MLKIFDKTVWFWRRIDRHPALGGACRWCWSRAKPGGLRTVTMGDQRRRISSAR